MANITVKKSIIDLYVGYFNRVPDYDGYQYWIKQYDEGNSLEVISNEFFKAGATQFSAETGYSLDMSKEAFVRQLYDGILGRGPGSSLAPNATEVAYWVGKLDALNGDKGAMVLQMIKEIRDFDVTGNPAIKEVQDKFNNKMYASYLLLEDPAGALDVHGDYNFGETLYAGGPALTPEQKIVLGKQILTTITADVASIDSTITAFTATLAAPVTPPPPPPEYDSLTVGTDVKSGTKFSAGLEYTPGGDRVNTLQDEDHLTGTGTSDILIAELGNSNDNGGTTITPHLDGIETVKFAFTGSDPGAVVEVDLQDADGIKEADITRISNGANTARLTNINRPVETLKVFNTRDDATVTFGFDNLALDGKSDQTRVHISEANLASLTIESRDGADGFETINLSSESKPNTITNLVAEDLQTLNIVHNDGQGGDQKLTISNVNEQGSLRTVNASTFQADLDFTINAGIMVGPKDGSSDDMDFTLTSGSGNDTIRISDTVGTNDAIHTGTGTDTLAMSSGVSMNFLADKTPPTNTPNKQADTAQVTGVDVVTVTRTANGAAEAATLTVDMNQMDNNELVTLQNKGDANDGTATFVLHDMSTDEAAHIAIKHSTNTNNGVGDNAINVASVLSGAVNTVGVEIVGDANADPRFNFTLDTDALTPVVPATTPATYVKAVANLTITDSDSETNTIQLNDFADYTGTVKILGGNPGHVMNLDASANLYRLDQTGTEVDGLGIQDVQGGYAERLVAATIDASTYVDDLVVRLDTPAYGQHVMGGTGNDSVIFDAQGNRYAGLTNSDTVAGSTGFDTLVIDGHFTDPASNQSFITIGASETANVAGMDAIRFVGANARDTHEITREDNYVWFTSAQSEYKTGYKLTLTNDLIDSTDNGQRILITNDSGNGMLESVEDNDTTNQGTADEDGITINARDLNGQNYFNYDGEENLADNQDFYVNDLGEFTDAAGTVLAAGAAPILNYENNIIDVFQFSDVSMNGKHVIDGGDDNTEANQQNSDVVQIFNDAVVTGTTTDWERIRNVGTIEFRVDRTTDQVLTMDLTDTVLENFDDSQIADADDAAVGAETITVRAVDNLDSFGDIDSAAQLDINASAVSENFVINWFLSGGDDTILAGAADDVLDGRGGDDSLDGGDGEDTVFGSFGNDTLSGGADDDTVAGGTGDDSMFGNDGDDLMDGQAGNDTMEGNDGDDSMFGGLGDDDMFGGDGDDDMSGQAGNDYMDGEAGDDSMWGGLGDDDMFGGDDDDNMSGEEGDDYMEGDAGDDIMWGGLDDDAMFGGDGDDTVIGEEGDDIVEGDAGEDSLFGNDGDDVMNGGDDNDTMSGGLGDDWMEGGAGDDSVFGDDGDDTLAGSEGDDTLVGGNGDDTYLFAATAADNGVDTFEFIGGAGTGDIIDVSAFLEGGNFNGGVNVANAVSEVIDATNSVVIMYSTNPLDVDTVADVVDAFNATGGVEDDFQIGVGAKSVVFAGTTGVDVGRLFYVEDTNNDGQISNGEVTLVGITSTVGDASGLTAADFVF